MGWLHRKTLVFLLFCLGSQALYGASFGNAYVLDDQAAVAENPLAQWPPQPLQILQANYWGNRPGYEKLTIYRPLATFSFALVDGLPGAGPGLQRGLNMLLHGLASFLVHLLGLAVGLGLLPSLAAGLLFLVHPVHSEAVLGVVSRAELLAAVFILLGSVLFLRWGARGALGRPGPIAALALVFLLALLSKENGATLLPGLLLLTLFGLPKPQHPNPPTPQQSNTPAAPTRSPWRLLHFVSCATLPNTPTPPHPHTLRRSLPLLASMALVLGAYFMLRHSMLSGVLAGDLAFEDNPMLGADLVGRCFTPFKVLWLYFGLLLFPASLTVDYSFAQVLPAASPLELPVLGGLLLAAALLWLLLRSLRGQGRAATLLLLFAGSYSVISNLAFLSTIIMAERVFYTPSAFLILLLVLLGARCLRPRLALGLLLLLGLAGGARTALRIPDFASPLALARSAAQAAPNSAKSRHLLAIELARQGQLPEALAEYEAALAISPANFNMLTNYGLALQEAGRDEDALEAFLRAQDASGARHRRSWNLMCNTALRLGRQEVLTTRCGVPATKD